MFYYRLYSLDSISGHFIDVFQFLSECDASAIEQVASEQRAVARELWNCERKVKDFPATPVPCAKLDDSNRLAGLIAAGGRWRWNPLATHCQIVADNDAAGEPEQMPEPGPTANFNPGDASCARHCS